MGKKKASAKPEPMDKARLELRFDHEVFEGVRKLADEAGISVNQLMLGLAQWAVQHGKVGEPIVTQGKFFEVKDQPGVVYFGERWIPWRDADEKLEHQEEIRRDYDIPDYKAPAFKKEGSFFFMLDFTVRRVVREK